MEFHFYTLVPIPATKNESTIKIKPLHCWCVVLIKGQCQEILRSTAVLIYGILSTRIPGCSREPIGPRTASTVPGYSREPTTTSTVPG